MSSLANFVNPPLPAAVQTDSVYTLWYRQGVNPHPLTKNFHAKGSMREVIERCKNHCDMMNIRFIRVVPFMSNLEEEERRSAAEI